jgi:hypothetical protein
MSETNFPGHFFSNFFQKPDSAGARLAVSVRAGRLAGRLPPIFNHHHLYDRHSSQQFFRNLQRLKKIVQQRFTALFVPLYKRRDYFFTYRLKKKFRRASSSAL